MAVVSVETLEEAKSTRLRRITCILNYDVYIETIT